MKKFIETNTITHNLMSFSGFKSLLIFTMLIKKPMSYEEIIQALEDNEYLNETVSIDTVRIYINSLKLVGCSVKKIHEGRKVKYFIDSNPFELKITDKQVKSIIKIYKAISKSIDINDFVALQQLFNKITPYITNNDLKAKLQYISPISNINKQLLKDLTEYTNYKTQIKILYYSKNSGEKEIEILPDKMNITNGKLYLSGYSMEYKNYASFLVSDIRKIISVNFNPNNVPVPEITVVYEYIKDDNSDFVPNENEKIIKRGENKLLVEIVSQNKFELTQRILSLSNKCRVISPVEYKDEIISCIKKIKEGYIIEG